MSVMFLLIIFEQQQTFEMCAITRIVYICIQLNIILYFLVRKAKTCFVNPGMLVIILMQNLYNLS